MTTKPFFVNVAALRPTPGGRHHVVRTGRMDGLEITSSAVPADGDVQVDVDLEVVDGGVVVTGTVSSAWIGECRRCLGPVTGEVAAKVREVFERTPRQRNGSSDDGDDDTYPLTGDTLDLEPLARDAILLELPLAPLCRADCAGLCPTCGADLSEAPCDCADQPVYRVWSVLDSLHFPQGADEWGAEESSGGPPGADDLDQPDSA